MYCGSYDGDSVGTPYKTFNDLVQAAKSKPGAIGYGTIGSGSMAHLAMTYLGNSLKLDWTHIPYKGGGPLATDGVAGHVPVTMAITLSEPVAPSLPLYNHICRCTQCTYTQAS